MSGEPPKVLTAGGAATGNGLPAGKNKSPNRGSRGGNRRRKKKSAAPAAAAAAEADLLGTHEHEHDAKPMPTVAVGEKKGKAKGSGSKPSMGQMNLQQQQQQQQKQRAGAKSKASAMTVAVGVGVNNSTCNAKPRPASAATSPDNNPQTGSPPLADSANNDPSRPPTGSPPPPPLAPTVLVAGGGAKGGGGGRGPESDGSSHRRSENRLPGGGGAAERGVPNRGGNSGDDYRDDDAFLKDNVERHIGEMKKKKPGRELDDLYGSPPTSSSSPGPLSSSTRTAQQKSKASDLIWLFACFLGIMGSFVVYGLLLEYTTSGGRKLHELSFLFVTSALYTVTAAAGRYVRQETPTSIPPARFAVLGLTSMGSTFCSVRSLRYVIYPIQVLAKSCKPVPVMIMGAIMGKRYPPRKYVNVLLIVAGVGLFMGGGSSGGKSGKGVGSDGDGDEEVSTSSQAIGVLLLFVSLCFDGGTGAYEDKLMSVHSVQPFDLMYNIQLGKTILAGVGLVVLNQVHVFLRMCQEMGFLLVALGLSGAMGQVFIFVTISKFGALTCSIIGLARKVTTLIASIYFYGHELNGIQFTGLAVAVGSMVMNFWGKSGKKGGGSGSHGHGGGGGGGGGGHGFDGAGEKNDVVVDPGETKRMVSRDDQSNNAVTNGSGHCDIELGPVKKGGTRAIS